MVPGPQGGAGVLCYFPPFSPQNGARATSRAPLPPSPGSPPGGRLEVQTPGVWLQGQCPYTLSFCLSAGPTHGEAARLGIGPTRVGLESGEAAQPHSVRTAS